MEASNATSILVIDFGSQSAHLITRRIKELGTSSKLILPEKALAEIKKHKPKGIILSGGPAEVYKKDAPIVDPAIFEMGIPLLGICYGEQLMAHLLGGKTQMGAKKEFGPAYLHITQDSTILKSLPDKCNVWMSHGVEISAPPAGFKIIAKTQNSPYAAVENEKKKLYGIQFHPEVVHTQFGMQILTNFLLVCGIKARKQSIDNTYVKNLTEDIKESVGKGTAICALSGGVDSSVAALLVHKAIGNQLTSIYIDSGLMRKGETEDLRRVFLKHYHMKVKIVNAKNIFLNNLKGVVDPEKKRMIIGKTFIDVLEKEAKATNASFLVQGTIYPDVIESAGTKHSQKIKSHHNVAGLPKNMKLALIEPLRELYKDEVRKIGSLLGLPDAIVKRQPFPGPGLAIRIIGEVTEKKLEIVRNADAIIQEEVQKVKLEKDVWQIFAIFAGIQTTGVRGDERIYGETIAIRALIAKDAMSANFARLPYPLLEKISVRIVNEIKEVNRVVYDITNKPPGTMEWE